MTEIRRKSDIVKLLMERDHMGKNEAVLVVATVQQLIDECLEQGDYDGVEDIMLGYLRLEMDYVYLFI